MSDLNRQIATQLFGWKADAVPIPQYTTAPAATLQVMAWLERLRVLHEIVFEYARPTRPRSVACAIVYRVAPLRPGLACARGAGSTWQNALCRAALALAEALAPPGEEEA